MTTPATNPMSIRDVCFIKPRAESNIAALRSKAIAQTTQDRDDSCHVKQERSPKLRHRPARKKAAGRGCTDPGSERKDAHRCRCVFLDRRNQTEGTKQLKQEWRRTPPER